MLLTGSSKKEILDFYRNADYNSTDKTAFIQWIHIWRQLHFICVLLF